ncbi:hypothetical protein J6590_105586 [Homalodisca vitripennis]|nr:hypothetical protein J6590_105586 [Homalodisca vitripennis]
MEYACENLKRGIQDMKIGIFTHNQAGLKAMSSSESRSGLQLFRGDMTLRFSALILPSYSLTFPILNILSLQKQR